MSTDDMPISAENEGWTNEMNARRFELLDIELDGGLTKEEKQELAALTRRMRGRVDSLTILPENLLENLEDEAGKE